MSLSHIFNSDNLDTAKSIMKKTWKQYMLCLMLGCAWGLICQLAMVGTISLSSTFKVSSPLWFEGTIVFFCTIVTTGGPIVIRSLILHFASKVDTEVGRENEESMKVDNSSILLLFSLLGSNVSCESFVKIS